MRIVQLSDLHVNKKRFSNDNRFPLKQLIDDLQEQNQRKNIDLILITGDIVDQGGRSFNRTENYYDLIEEKIVKPIYQNLGIPKQNIFIIPGNHDINRNKIDEDTFAGLMERLKSTETINMHITQYRNSYKVGLRGIENYNKFEKKRYQRTKNCYISNFESGFIFDYHGINIGIAAFNSAWACFKESDSGPVLFGTQQILNASDFFHKPKKATAFNIGMVHHPLDLLNDFEATEAEAFLRDQGFNLLLCGHTHQDHTGNYQKRGSELLISVARSAFSSNKEKIEEFRSGYKIIDFSYSKDSYIDITITYRKYARTGKFDYDTDSGEKGGSETFYIQVTEKNRRFFEHLKKKSQLLTEERKRVFEELSNKTKMMLESSYPTISDQVLETIINKILSFKEFDHYRQNMRLEYTIKESVKGHFELQEIQTFDIISTGKGLEYKVDAYVDIEDQENDKSDIVINKLLIDGKDYTKKVKYASPEINSQNKNGERNVIIRKKIYLLKRLPGKATYRVERSQTSIHNLNSNGIWKTSVGAIIKGISVYIKNMGNYKVDLVEFGNNTNFEREILGIGTIRRGEKIEAVHEGILMPGDGFMIIVNPV